jgi:hypothetical protein
LLPQQWTFLSTEQTEQEWCAPVTTIAEAQTGTNEGNDVGIKEMTPEPICPKELSPQQNVSSSTAVTAQQCKSPHEMLSKSAANARGRGDEENTVTVPIPSCP